jgi:hypothetical protein
MRQLSLVTLLYLALASSLSCTYRVPALNGGCYEYDLSRLPDRNWTLHDAYPMTYAANAPCNNVLGAKELCSNNPEPSPAFAVVTKTCYSLGNKSKGHVAPFSWGNPEAGVKITMPGGVAGRTLVYNMVCNTSFPASSGPDPFVVENPSLTYTITWHTAAACPVLNTTAQCPVVIPKPTPAQLAYQRAEIVAIVCFQMDTYAGDGEGALK